MFLGSFYATYYRFAIVRWATSWLSCSKSCANFGHSKQCLLMKDMSISKLPSKIPDCRVGLDAGCKCYSEKMVYRPGVGCAVVL